jgi:hypothetical protein
MGYDREQEINRSDEFVSEPILNRKMLEKDGYRPMLEGLVDLPEKLRAVRNELLATRRKLDGVQSERQDIERRVFSEICAQKSEDGKNAYTNEKARETATAEKLKKDSRDQELCVQESELIYKQHDATTRLEYLQDVQRSLKLIIQVLDLKRED